MTNRRQRTRDHLVEPAGPAASEPEGARVPGRIRGIDAARALAIVGMVMVHFGPTGPEPVDTAHFLYGVSHGRASILFVLLAGIGVSLLAGDRSPGRLRSAWLQLAFRAAVLLPLGLALQMLDFNVLVILQYYALYFVVAGLAVVLPDRVVLLVSGALAVGGPAVYRAAERARPEWYDRGDPAVLTDPPWEILRDLLLTGSYPVVVWAAPVLFGLWLGRRDLRDPVTRLACAGGGIMVSTAAYTVAWVLPEHGWWGLLSAEAHSQMVLWVVGATAVAVTILAVMLAVADRLPRLLWPLIAMGQLALTVYVGHLLVLAVQPDLLIRVTVGEAFRVVGVFTVVTAALAVAWRALLPRGPLEAVLRLPSTLREVLRRAG